MRYGFCGAVLALALNGFAGEAPTSESPTVKLKNSALDLGGGVSLDLIEIPAGEFEMGSPPTEKERDGNETPHPVKLTKAFWIGKFEVTNAQFRKFRPEHVSGQMNGEN